MDEVLEDLSFFQGLRYGFREASCMGILSHGVTEYHEDAKSK